MKISDHLRIPETCADCKKRPETFFCNLSEPAFTELQSLKVSHVFPRGSTIFMEGQPSEGVYLLCDGRVKLSTYSEEGRAIILRIAEAGEVLGSCAVISGTPYEKTAQATEPCRVSFIKRSSFLDFVQTHHEAALNALKQLSSNYHKAHLQICSLGLSASAGDKLARLLLQWCERSPNGDLVRISPTHTHGEIGEMIGTSRETVTRLFKDFRDRQLITFSKTELCIPDRARLKAAIGAKHGNGHG
jgi:CRP/FNR family cyclic AMP-dependent transcriptional regulator